MPFPAYMANRLARRLGQVRKDGTLAYLRPDGKTQVTVEYEGDTPLRVTAFVVSTQHDPDVVHEQIVRDMIEHVIRPVIPAVMLDAETEYYINPTGRSSSGDPPLTWVSLVASSSSTPMAAWPAMAEAPSRARTRPRATARSLWPRDTAPRTSSLQGLLHSMRFRCHMLWASRIRCLSTSVPSGRPRSTKRRSKRGWRRSST